MSGSARAWLAAVPWDLVVYQNAALCAAKNALHKATSDGYEETKKLWDTEHGKPMTLFEVVNFCRQCHKHAPFCFYNGNTFAAVARSLIASLDLEATRAAAVRSLAGHIVAGVASDEEIKAFRAFSESLA